MRVQLYRTEEAAMRYAREIMAHFPSVTAWAQPYESSYAVRVRHQNGTYAYAGTRPRNYGKRPVTARHISGIPF